jgi:hypothetical protein
MKKIISFLMLLVVTIGVAQNQTFTGVKTFTTAPKFQNLSNNNSNTKVLTISGIDQLQWRNASTFVSPTPTLQEVLDTETSPTVMDKQFRLGVTYDGSLGTDVSPYGVTSYNGPTSMSTSTAGVSLQLNNETGIEKYTSYRNGYINSNVPSSGGVFNLYIPAKNGTIATTDDITLERAVANNNTISNGTSIVNENGSSKLTLGAGSLTTENTSTGEIITLNNNNILFNNGSGHYSSIWGGMGGYHLPVKEFYGNYILATLDDIPSYTIPTLGQVVTAGGVTTDPISIRSIDNLYQSNHNYLRNELYDYNSSTSQRYELGEISFEDFSGASTKNTLKFNKTTAGNATFSFPEVTGFHTLATTDQLPIDSNLVHRTGDEYMGGTKSILGQFNFLDENWTKSFHIDGNSGASYGNQGEGYAFFNNITISIETPSSSVGLNNDKIFFHNTALNKGVNLKLSNDAISGGFDVTLPDGNGQLALKSDINQSSSIFTPSFSNPYQLTVVTSDKSGSYIQVGDIVTVTVPLVLTPTAAGLNTVDISLPVPSNSSYSDTFSGVVTLFHIGEGASGVVKIVNNQIATLYITTTAASGTYYGSAVFSYKKQ